MIISISGYINSGKDTFATAFQLLHLYRNKDFSEDIYNYFTEDELIKYYIEHHNDRTLNIHSIIKRSNIEIKKWADKLKDIVCIILNCTREQLEDRNFKETPLPIEWSRTLVEDTSKYYPCKCIECTWRGSSENANGGYSIADTGDYSDVVCPKCGSVVEECDNNYDLTPRLLLQLLGTDCGRNIIHPNIWINSLLSTYKPKLVQDGISPDKLVWLEQYPFWIITDTRFKSEFEAITDLAHTVRLNRLLYLYDSLLDHHYITDISKNFISCYNKEDFINKPSDISYFDYVKDKFLEEYKNSNIYKQLHISEREIDSFKCDYEYTIEDGLDNLIRVVKDLYDKIMM